MRPCDVTLAFWFSCVQFFYSVDSQSCTSGWFGSNCKYKCRCNGNTCDGNGNCYGANLCERGWFGPRCQYVDTLSGSTRVQSRTELTDGNDATCSPRRGIENITVVLDPSLKYMWMRIVVTQLGSSDLVHHLIRFYDGATEVFCAEVSRYLVGTSTLDILCNNATEWITSVTVEGGFVDHLCSVYISGGRNVALKENTNQSSTHTEAGFSYVSSLAVDGNTNPNLAHRSCMGNVRTSSVPYWFVHFSQPRIVFRYLVHNTKPEGWYIRFCTATSYNQQAQEVFSRRDGAYSVKDVYVFDHHPLIISTVKISADNYEKKMFMCEVEVYGDSVCDAVHYGIECQESCSCPHGDACFVATGQCPFCLSGYQEKGCLKKCNVGKFGFRCSSDCSQSCKDPNDATISPCHHVNGECVTGCKRGYNGTFCQSECAFGSYGDGCNSLCSVNCQPLGNANMSPCHHVTGACAKGCNAGYKVPTCEQVCDVGYFGNNCSKPCSMNCEPDNNTLISPCHHITGLCIGSCKDGFIGGSCENVCDVGYFGMNCSKPCSKNCAPANDTLTSPCHHITGHCIWGCTGDFTGRTCHNATHSTGYSLETIIGLCTLAAMILFIGFCLARRRKTVSSEEGGHESGQPENSLAPE